jgi:hypothetical protein
MRDVAKDHNSLRTMFEEYHPVTTSMKRSKEMAWICLPDEETQNRFVADTHRKERFGVVWIAHALSPLFSFDGYHPQKAQKLLKQDMPLLGNENLQREKQAKRRAWREETNDNGGDDALSPGMDLLDMDNV